MAVVAEMDREFSSGNVTYDLAIVPHRLLGKYVAKGYVMPIDRYLEDRKLVDPAVFNPEKDLLPGWWREISWYQNRPYGFPFMALTMYTWFRRDLFDDRAEQTNF